MALSLSFESKRPIGCSSKTIDIMSRPLGFCPSSYVLIFTQLAYGQLSHSLEVQEPSSIVRVVVVVVGIVAGYKLFLFDLGSFPFACALLLYLPRSCYEISCIDLFFLGQIGAKVNFLL